MNDVHWESYSVLGWWIDRLGHMEFLSDQMFGLDDRIQDALSQEAWRNQYKPGYLSEII